MRTRLFIALTVFILFLIPELNFGQAPDLGAASSFALFTSAGAFNNTGPSIITGNIGSFTSDPVGFPPGIVMNGAIYGPTDALSATVAGDVLGAYGDLSADGCVTTLVLPLAGQILVAGVYCFPAAATLNGVLTLDGQGNPNALFIIKINGAFATTGGSNINLINSASPNNVYWQIGGEFDLVDGSVFKGTVIVDGAINLLGTASLIGRGLSVAGAINIAANMVTLGIPPAAPTLALTQPTCIVSSGTIVVTTPLGAGMTYSIGGAYQSSATFNTVAPGTYTVYAENADGYFSAGTPVTINAAPAVPATPTASATLQPTCSAPTGTITITAPTGADITYSIDGSTYTNTTGVFTLVPAGTYTVTAKNAAGCISSGTSVTINAAPGAPATPTASATLQPTCNVPTGTITITAPTGAGITYSIDGSNYTNTTGVFTVVPSGTYTVTAQNASGCISPGTPVTINAAPEVPAAPTASATLQPTCNVPTGTITITAPTGAGITYSIDGSTYTNTTG
ncbi:MAG: ice-binding family protein, partial [Bacteroidia bacterium]|nr:ice-binding family protein [Bacteroidia bacterium]